MSLRSSVPAGKQNLLTQKHVALYEKGDMRICKTCQQPMISAGPECGHCKPTAGALALIDKAVKPKKGTLGDSRNLLHTDLKYFDKAAPPSKCFYFWAVKPKNWPIIAVAVQQLKEMSKLDYRPKSSPWSPEFTNASSHQFCKCGCSKQGTAIVQDRGKPSTGPFESLFVKRGLEFKQLVIAEQLAEQARRAEMRGSA